MQVDGDESSYVDNLPFVWNRYEQRGYATLYTEDAAGRHCGTFHDEFHGFQHPPVNHYMRPFWQAVDFDRRHRRRRRRHDNNHLSPQQQLHESDETATSRCAVVVDWCDGRRRQRLVLRYVADFLSSNDAYPPGVPLFAFAVVDGTSAGLDVDLERFFETTMSERRRQRRRRTGTVLVVVSTPPPPRGRREQPLAVVALVPGVSSDTDRDHRHQHHQPTSDVNSTHRVSVVSKMAANLIENVDRLTSPMDIYASLISLLDIPSSQVRN